MLTVDSFDCFGNNHRPPGKDVHASSKKEIHQSSTRLFGSSMETILCMMHLDMEAQKDEKKEQPAEPQSEPAKPEPPGEPAMLETGQASPEPAKLEPDANTRSNKGRQVKKCCPLWAKFIFLQMASRDTRASRTTLVDILHRDLHLFLSYIFLQIVMYCDLHIFWGRRCD